jgi:hypothetical protein
MVKVSMEEVLQVSAQKFKEANPQEIIQADDDNEGHLC